MSRSMCRHAIDRQTDFCPDCATPDELREALSREEEDNERLRALIKGAEFEGCVGRESDPACPWCGAEKGTSEQSRETHQECPAFTADGEVR